jgi:IPT/TIG domain
VSGGQASVTVPAGGTGVGALAAGVTHACQFPIFFGDVSVVPTRIAHSIPAPGNQAAVVLHTPAHPPPPTFVTAFPSTNVPISIVDQQPRFGPQSGGTPTTVTGVGFLNAPTTKVLVDGAAAGNVLVSSTTITAFTPPQPPPAVPGLVDLQVVNADGQSDVVPGGFEYTLALVVKGVQPGSGSVAGGEPVRITGLGFLAGAEARFGGLPAQVDSVATDQILVRTPAQPGPGFVDVEVHNPDPDRQLDVLPLGFEYRPP